MLKQPSIKIHLVSENSWSFISRKTVYLLVHKYRNTFWRNQELCLNRVMKEISIYSTT